MSESAPDGTERITAERQRQVTAEGWTAAHDDTHAQSEMTAAACCYAALARRQADGVIKSAAKDIMAPSGWPWDWEWWKPSDDPIRNLVKAGALIAADIDRLQRALDVDGGRPSARLPTHGMAGACSRPRRRSRAPLGLVRYPRQP
jgi:hypothetical protein